MRNMNVYCFILLGFTVCVSGLAQAEKVFFSSHRPTPHYDEVYQNVLEPYCVLCHYEGNEEEAIFDFSKKEIVKYFMDLILDSCVANDRMPPGFPLAAEEKKLLVDWYQAGMPD
ncbi:MAG: hypothetical protein HY537_08745 [Deltaproteobacteria bacterium]|nr:hypothetical protein [Deltaproteobacteria bacterium]